jgi:hypothetical protein
MTGFDDALGHGPDGPKYRPPTVRRRTPLDKVKSWAWYRWGVGKRPAPKFVEPEIAPERGRRRAG